MSLGKKDFNRIVNTLVNKGIRDPFKQTIMEYLSGLSRYVNITNVLLYGSVARGKPLLGKSDIDLIVIAKEFDISRDDLFRLKRKIRGKLPGLVESLWMSKKEFIDVFKGLTGFILDALYEGVILYDEDNFLHELRSRLFKAIEKGVIQRYKNFWRFPKVVPGKKVNIEI